MYVGQCLTLHALGSELGANALLGLLLEPHLPRNVLQQHTHPKPSSSAQANPRPDHASVGTLTCSSVSPCIGWRLVLSAGSAHRPDCSEGAGSARLGSSVGGSRPSAMARRLGRSGVWVE
jgi:hypothetical protein